MGIAVVAWVLAVLVNATCSHDVCEAAEDGLVNVYLFVLFGMCVVMWRQIRGELQICDVSNCVQLSH
jgi:hypothetical protein